VKVINDDRATVSTKVAVKQLHCMPISVKLKWLYLSVEKPSGQFLGLIVMSH
jgi:hypothetical protein